MDRTRTYQARAMTIQRRQQRNLKHSTPARLTRAGRNA